MSLGIDRVAGKAVLTGPWEAGYLERFVESGADQLIVGPAADLEFLRDLPPLNRLDVQHLPLKDVRPIQSQPTLRKLTLNAYYKTPLDFSFLPALRFSPSRHVPKARCSRRQISPRIGRISFAG